MTAAVVRRDDATRQSDGFQRPAAFEHQQDLAVGNAEDAEAVVAEEFPEAEQVFVEPRCALEVVKIEAGFQYAGHVRHGHFPFPLCANLNIAAVLAAVRILPQPAFRSSAG